MSNDKLFGYPVVHTDNIRVNDKVVFADWAPYISVELTRNGTTIFSGRLADLHLRLTGDAADRLKKSVSATIEKFLEDEYNEIMNGSGSSDQVVGILKNPVVGIPKLKQRRKQK